jgi:hypothetical protein
MKNIAKIRGFLILAIALTLLLSQAAIVQSAALTAEDKALAFITDVFQLDMTKYNAELATYSVDYPNELNGIQQEHVKYELQASGSTVTAFSQFNNGSLTACSISVTTGALIYAQQSENKVDMTRGILDRYQTYADNANLKQMIDLLQTVSANKNESKIAGDLKLEVTTDAYHTSYEWKYTFNGVDYNAVSIIYQDSGVFFSDYLSLYKIGNTNVDISREQAIDIAMKYIETYSYTGVVTSEGKEITVEISGFNISKELTEANLATNFREPLTFYPCWNIELYLDQKQPYANYTYPSGVYALHVGIWADNGEVFTCTPLAVGGIIPDSESAAESSPLSEGNPPVQPLNQITIAGIVAAILVGTIAIAAIAYKKKSK